MTEETASASVEETKHETTEAITAEEGELPNPLDVQKEIKEEEGLPQPSELEAKIFAVGHDPERLPLRGLRRQETWPCVGQLQRRAYRYFRAGKGGLRFPRQAGSSRTLLRAYFFPRGSWSFSRSRRRRGKKTVTKSKG